jgi:hypothetical protein
MLCQCWSYFFHWFNIDKMLNVLVLYQCHFRTCRYNVTLTSYQWLYQHWTLNILLRCCKSTHTKRGQVCDDGCISLTFLLVIMLWRNIGRQPIHIIIFVNNYKKRACYYLFAFHFLHMLLCFYTKNKGKKKGKNCSCKKNMGMVRRCEVIYL